MKISIENLQTVLSDYESLELVTPCIATLAEEGTIVFISSPKQTSRVLELYKRRAKLYGDEKIVKGYPALLPQLEEFRSEYIILMKILTRRISFTLFVDTDYRKLIGILGSGSSDLTYKQYEMRKDDFAYFIKI